MSVVVELGVIEQDGKVNEGNGKFGCRMGQEGLLSSDPTENIVQLVHG